MSNKEQLNEVAPLVAALMGALVGMGLERNKAQQAAQQAVADAGAGDGAAGAAPANAQPAAPAPQGDDYNQTMRRGSRGEGVKQLQQKLGMRQADGIFGPATEKAVRTFQQSQGLKVDGIVGPETRARIMKLASNAPAAGDEFAARRNAAVDRANRRRIDPGTTAGGPSRLKQRLAAQTGEGVNMSNKNVTNEAVSFDVEDLVRLMQLAGADNAKAVDADDINPGPKPCPICGKMHGPSQPLGGCGAKSNEPEMGDMIRMISAEEEELDGDFKDASTEPDEEYANDVSASIPAGNDLHKKKKAYPAVDGGDNPMTAENLEAKIKEYLKK